METNGYVAIDASHYNRLTGTRADVKEISGLGRSGCLLLYLPDIKDGNVDTSFPILEYDVWLSSIGVAKIYVYCLPTHRINRKMPLCYTVAINDAAPKAIDFDAIENSHPWSANVLQAAAITCSQHKIEQKGHHVLKIGMADPGVVIDKIVIDMGGLIKSYLGPSETRVML